MEVLKQITFEKYPNYKDSGLKWISQLPSHWEIVRSKRLFDQRKEKGEKGDVQLTSSQKYGIIPQQEFMELEGRKVTQVVFNNDILKKVRENDFVISMRSFQGGLEYSNYSGCMSSAYIALAPIKKVVPEFYKYLFKSSSYIRALSSTSNLVRDGQAMRFDNFTQIDLYIVPEEEQIAIASFLDNKTAKIDTAITQKEKMIGLLKERKQIMTQNAVTKGLDENAKLKDCGIEWFGEIPEHWEVKRLKHIVKGNLKYGANESGIEYNRDLPRYIRITDFSSEGKLNEEKKLSLTWSNGKDYLLKGGDILFARSGATVGKSYQFKTSMSNEKHYAFAGYLIRARPDEINIKSDFLMYFTNSGSFDSWKSSIFNKATIENIGADKYSQLFIPIPPISEQSKIVSYIKIQSSKLDKVIDLQRIQIEKLKEYKATLIDSAVTGKIKVTE
jgi:type I restriction enzyme S subunit